MDTTNKAFFDTTGTGQKRFYRTVMVGVADTNLLWIPPGTFLMGSPDAEEGRTTNEGPQTLVTLTSGFFMGRYEVRNREWIAIMGSILAPDATNANYLDWPVHQVGWGASTNYCALRTASEQGQGLIPPGWAYRLPTEAEWEYACRAGTTTPFPNGSELRNDDVRQDARFNGTAPYPTNSPTVNPSAPDVPTIVGRFSANGFGLYDMCGNAEEWCQDGYDTPLPPAYPGGNVTNPLGTGFINRVLRGGGYLVVGAQCRSASRRVKAFITPASPQNGLRVVLAPVGP